MAGGIPFSQALQIIGGVPLQKVGSVFAEKLSITKRLDGGAIGNLMKQVIKDGNLSSLMQNPMQGALDAVQQQAQQALQRLGGIPGVQSLTSALSGLQGAATSFQAAGDNLAGLTNGAAGFMAMLGHDQTAQLAGDAMPATAATAVVTAPLTSSGLLAQASAVLPQIASQVASGTLDATSAAAWVTGISGQMTGIVQASADALAWSAANHTVIAAAATIGGALAVPPVFDDQGNRSEGVPTGFQGVLQSVVQPHARDAIAAALAAQTKAKTYKPIDPDDYTSLEG